MYKLFPILFLCIGSVFSANPMQPDNMIPKVEVKTQAGKPVARVIAPPRLEDIVIIGKFKSAVFRGNKTVELGEWINGYRLTEVTPNYVVLTKGQRKEQLYLKAYGEVKITPAKED